MACNMYRGVVSRRENVERVFHDALILDPLKSRDERLKALQELHRPSHMPSKLKIMIS